MSWVTQIVQAFDAASVSVPDGLRATTFGPSVMDALHQAIPDLRAAYGLDGPAELDTNLLNKMLDSIAR
jgi:hypothetical protein